LSTVNSSTFVLSDPSGALVPGAVAYNSANFTATFTPGAPLAPNTKYMVGISSGVTNIADTPVTGRLHLEFHYRRDTLTESRSRSRPFKGF